LNSIGSPYALPDVVSGQRRNLWASLASREQNQRAYREGKMAEKKYKKTYPKAYPQTDWKFRVYVELDDYQDNFASPLEKARIEFLGAVRSVEPEVLSSLAEHVLPLYPHRRELKDWMQLEAAVAKEITPIVVKAAESKGYVIPEIDFKHLSLVKLRDTLLAWASSWLLAWKSEPKRGGVENEWILCYALETLLLWRQTGVPKDLDWAYISWDVDINGLKLVDRARLRFDKSSGFEFTYSAYDKNRDSWPDYSKRIKEAFKERLKEYQAQVVLSPGDKGLQRKRKSRKGEISKAPNDIHWHYLLLALSQIHHPSNPYPQHPFRPIDSNLRLTQEGLLKHLDVDAFGQNVGQAIDSVAKVILFTKYERNPGPLVTPGCSQES